jgi:signal transduction histidine kinase
MSANTGSVARRLARAPVTRDAVVAMIAFALTLVLLGGGANASRDLDPLGVVLAAVASFPLIAHRRAPLAVLAVTTAASATINGLGYALGPPFGATIALFYIAWDERTRTRLRETAIVLLGLFALHVGVTAITRGSPAVPILAGAVVWGGAWIAGDQLRQRRQRRADLEERARRAERDLERERRLAASEERTRIARDLHDSAAHAINVILVQAGAARLLQDRDPGAAQDALTTIEDVARETIGEIDQLVSGLRETGANANGSIDPPTGLAALHTLAERHRAAGHEVKITVAGRPRPLAPGLDQAAYRILQESLTNAARHGSGPAEVRIDYGEHELQLSISNPTRVATGCDRIDGGHGILGMRERAALLGGGLTAIAHAGSFDVYARLPYVSQERR